MPISSQNEPEGVEASLDFQTNGVGRSVVLSAMGRDVVRLHGTVIEHDTEFTADRPYQVFDSLVVAPGVTLTVAPGAELYFHDGAYMGVRGTLKAVGQVDKEIQFAGDRVGFVAADIPFDLMSRQWQGMFFVSTSGNSEMSYCHVRNTVYGVSVDGTLAQGNVPSLTLINSRLRNSGGYALEMHHANLYAYGSEIAEAASGALLLDGGEHIINHCTLANYYLFEALAGPILQFSHIRPEEVDEGLADKPVLSADISNTVIYGLGSDVSHGDLTGTNVYLRRCLLKSNGTDDDNFLNCLWGADPLYRTVRNDYYFDYRFKEESPAIGTADPALTALQAATDRYGLSRGSAPDLGAYVYVPEEPVDEGDM